MLFVQQPKILDNNQNGKVEEELKNDTLILPGEVEMCRKQIIQTLKKLAGNLNIKNADYRKKVKLNKVKYLSEDANLVIFK